MPIQRRFDSTHGILERVRKALQLGAARRRQVGCVELRDAPGRRIKRRAARTARAEWQWQAAPRISPGLSRKGYWRLARTLSTHTGMTNAWLSEQGVLSLKELWVNIHYPEGKASKHRLPC